MSQRLRSAWRRFRYSVIRTGRFREVHRSKDHDLRKDTAVSRVIEQKSISPAIISTHFQLYRGVPILSKHLGCSSCRVRSATPAISSQCSTARPSRQPAGCLCRSRVFAIACNANRFRLHTQGRLHRRADLWRQRMEYDARDIASEWASAKGWKISLSGTDISVQDGSDYVMAEMNLCHVHPLFLRSVVHSLDFEKSVLQRSGRPLRSFFNRRALVEKAAYPAVGRDTAIARRVTRGDAMPSTLKSRKTLPALAYTNTDLCYCPLCAHRLGYDDPSKWGRNWLPFLPITRPDEIPEKNCDSCERVPLPARRVPRRTSTRRRVNLLGRETQNLYRHVVTLHRSSPPPTRPAVRGRGPGRGWGR